MYSYERKINSKYILFAILLIICCGCGVIDKYKVDKLEKLWREKKYRQLVVEYNKTITSLKSIDQIERAKYFFDNSRNIVDKSQALIDSADILASQGYAPQAYRLYSRALELEPNEAIISEKRKATPIDGAPIYTWAGKLGNIDFIVTYHTEWIGNNCIPSKVILTINNNDPMQPVIPVSFVPVINYESFSYNEMHVLMVIFDPPFPREFTVPLWKGKTKSLTLKYGNNARIINNRSDLSLSEVFKRIMLGNDNACYISFLGYRYVKLSGFILDGYDTKESKISLVDRSKNIRDAIPIDIIKSTSSSILQETQENKYYSSLAYDKKPETAWQEGAEGQGVGEWIQFEFRGLWKVEKIRLLNGYCKYSKTGVDRYPQNSRIKTAVLHFSDNSTQEIQLSDTREYQEITIKPVKTSYVKLVIKDYYPGTRWSDNSLSEIEFYGN